MQAFTIHITRIIQIPRFDPSTCIIVFADLKLSDFNSVDVEMKAFNFFIIPNFST
jgi:hypothetical protein